MGMRSRAWTMSRHLSLLGRLQVHSFSGTRYKPSPTDTLAKAYLTTNQADIDFYNPPKKPRRNRKKEQVAKFHEHLKLERMEGLRKDCDTNVSPVRATIEIDPKSKLDECQQQVIDNVIAGHNVFLTGAAGTGKSHVLHAIIATLKRKYGHAFDDLVAVTASTGVAAVAMQGQTLHSFAGVGVPNNVAVFERAATEKRIMNKWSRVETLIIDEISMLSPEYMEWLDDMVREIRGNDCAFGNVQLVFCGDFAQLMPVPGRFDLKILPDKKEPEIPVGVKQFGGSFLFQTQMWEDAKFQTSHLTTVYRQNDPEFMHALNDIRMGGASDNTLALLSQCTRDLDETNGIKPTILYCMNKDCDNENLARLKQLPGDLHTFNAVDRAKCDHDWQRARLDDDVFYTKECLARSVIELRVGAQVMLLKNIHESNVDNDDRLVNGSRGVVLGFTTSDEYTEHLEGLVADSKENSCNDTTFLENELTTFEQKLAKMDSFLPRFPIVRFRNNRELIITPVDFEKNVQSLGMCQRSQIPLSLAYAVTVHKAQGLSLDSVVVDLKGAFTDGQVYVALSRARDLRGLQIRNLEAKRIMCNDLVKNFYTKVEEGGGGDDQQQHQQQQHHQQQQQILPPKLSPSQSQSHVARWWKPVLNYPVWLEVFRKDPNFRKWEKEHGGASKDSKF